MAKNKIIVEIVTSDKGTSASIKNQEKLSKATDRTAKSTDRARKSRDKYNRVEKGAAGISSSSTKNFSKMQQSIGGDGGSGGLVRAYALLAANVFALTAAFGVLSRGAQVDTLLESIQALEIQSGRSIRSVARDLQEASGSSLDFASSLRSVSLASSAGFGSEQIAELGEVAKNASVALGRNLADGLDRIFRGVIKVEPELLDEIGLFVRVNEAAQKYAAELGKSAADLTEFEKRQAFANEAITQGQKKFDAFKAVDPDAFSQLAAALTDIAQSAITVVNKGLAPIINFLQANQGFLIAAFSGVALSILRQVVPAIGTFTLNARKAAEDAQDAFNDMQDDIASGLDRQRQAELALEEQKLSSAEASLKKARAEREGATSGLGGKGVKDAEGKLSRARTDETRINALIEKRNALERSRRKTTADRINAEQAAIDKEISALQEKLRIENTIKNIKQDEDGFFIAEGTDMDIQQKKLSAKLERARRIETIQTTAATKGYSAGLQQLQIQTVKAAGGTMSFTRALFTAKGASIALRGGVTLLAGAMSRLMAALGPISLAFTILAPLVAMAGKALGLGSKAQEKYTEELEKTNEMLDNFDDKLKRVNETMLNPNSGFQAQADALQAQNAALAETGRQLIELRNAANLFNAEASDFALFADSIGQDKLEEVQEKERDFLAQLIANSSNLSPEIIDALDKAGLGTKEREEIVKQQSQLNTQIAIQAEAEAKIAKLQKEGRNKRGKIDADTAAKIAVLREGVVESQKEEERLEKSIAGATKDILDNVDNTEKTISDIVDLSEEQSKASVITKSALDGAKDSAREFRKQYISKTEVDKPLASLRQTVAALEFTNRLGEENALSDKERTLRLDEIAAGENAVLDLLTEEQEALFKASEDNKERVAILKEARDEFERQQASLILQKQLIEDIKSETKRFNLLSKASSSEILRQNELLREQKNLEQQLLDFKVKNAALAADIQMSEIERLSGLTIEQILNDEAFKNLANQDQVLGVILQKKKSENAATDETLRQRKEIFTLEQDLLKLAQEELSERQKFTDALQEQEKLSAQMSSRNQRGRGLNAGEEFRIKMKQFVADRKLAKEKLSLDQRAIKARFDILKIEQDAREDERKKDFELLKARVEVLNLEETVGKERVESVLAFINQSIVEGPMDALDERGKILMETLSVEFANGLQKAIQDNDDFIDAIFKDETTLNDKIGEIMSAGGAAMANAADLTAQLDAETGGRGAVEAEIEKLMQVENRSEEQEARLKSLLEILKQYNSLDMTTFRTTMEMAKGTLAAYGEEFKKFGPEGEYFASINTFAISLIQTVESFASGGLTEKLAAVGNSIAAFGQMIMAEAKSNMAQIDSQIEAERKRDGKSKESLEKIKQLEKQKEQIGRKAFERNKKMQLASAAINTTSAVLQTMGTPGLVFPANVIMAALVGAMGLAQMALIKKQKYDGFTAPDSQVSTPTLSVGKRENRVDVSQSASAGELAFLRGSKGVGSSATNFTPAAYGRRNYAEGGTMLVGEKGPELITPTQSVDVIPNSALGGSGEVNVNFSINAIDGVSVQNMLNEQQGNIISMIRQAANDHGETFLETVEDTSYGGGGGG